MPSTILWRGDAPAVAQVGTFTVTAYDAATTYSITINGKSVSVAGVTSTAATATALYNALIASTIPEFTEITWTNPSAGVVKGTAKTAGVPFTATSGVSGGTGTIGAYAAVTANSGPADASLAANYDGAALPSNGDTLVFEKSANSCLYGLEALDGLTSLLVVVKQSFTGHIGLPKQHVVSGTTGYVEYRPRYFKADITLLDIGAGEGNGSARLMFDCSGEVCAAVVHNSGTVQTAGEYPILIIGTAAGSTLRVSKGVVGVAIYAGETANLDGGITLGYVTNARTDANVTCGSGVTLGNVTKTGGSLTLESTVGTITNYDGDLNTLGSMMATAVTMYGGNLIDQSSGTFTAVTLEPGATYDYRRGAVAKTITTLDIKPGAAAYYDPAGLVTITNGAKWMNCAKFVTKPDVAWAPV